jgi:hypothetical protein
MDSKSQKAIYTALFHYQSLYKTGMASKFPENVSYIPPVIEGLQLALKQVVKYEEIVEKLVIK